MRLWLELDIWTTQWNSVKLSIVGSLRDREVAASASDRQGSNFESCVWRTVSSHSSHHPQEVLLAQFSLYVHKCGVEQTFGAAGEPPLISPFPQQLRAAAIDVTMRYFEHAVWFGQYLPSILWYAVNKLVYMTVYILEIEIVSSFQCPNIVFITFLYFI